MERADDQGYSRNIGKAADSTEFKEIGSTGLTQNGSRTRDDFLKQLTGARGIANFREMSENDPTIGAMLHAIDMLIRSVATSVDVGGDGDGDAEAEDYAEFVASCLNDMTVSWADTISQILSFLPFGFSVHEIVYKRRGGASGEPRSAHNDGRIGWRKLAPRSQASIEEFLLDDNGGIQGVHQRDPSSFMGKKVHIPIDRMLLFRTRPDNPRGRSVLRNAFIPWYYKTKIQEIEAIGIERDLAGIPVALVPPSLLSNQPSANETAALTAVKEIVRNIKRDEQEGIVFPLAYDPDTKQLAYDLKLLSTGGRRQFDTNAVILRYDQRIAMTLLADFILLGQQAVGTQALSVSKIQLFIDSLKAWLDAIAGVFNQHAIPRLLRINGMNEAKAPRLVFAPPRNVDLGALSSFLTAMSGAGALLFPDEDLENDLRDLAGLPRAMAEEV